MLLLRNHQTVEDAFQLIREASNCNNFGRQLVLIVEAAMKVGTILTESRNRDSFIGDAEIALAKDLQDELWTAVGKLKDRQSSLSEVHADR